MFTVIHHCNKFIILQNIIIFKSKHIYIIEDIIQFCRHIASRQDQYNVSVLLLSRGAKVGEVNTMGETAIDCCSGNGDTMNALQLNFKVNQQSDQMLERTVKILTKYVVL
jgi:ankyrin repeat protein